MYSEFSIEDGRRYYICNKTNSLFYDNNGDIRPFTKRTSESPLTSNYDSPDSRRVSSPLKSNKPARLRIQLGQACNYDCTYCFQKDIGDPNERRESPSLDMFFHHMDTKFDLSHLTRVEPWGGEPFLYWKDMKRLLSYFDKEGLSFYISTNGSTLHRKHIDFFKTLKAEVTIGISHDGPGQLSLRGEEIFDKPRVIDVLRYIDVTDNVSWSINSIITKENYDLFEMSRFFYNVFENIGSTNSRWMYHVARLYTDQIETDYHYSQSDELILDEESLKEFKIIHEKFLEASSDNNLNKEGIVPTTFYEGDVRNIARGITQPWLNDNAHEVASSCGMDWGKAIDLDLKGNVIACVHSDKRSRSGHISDIDNVVIVGFNPHRKKDEGYRGCNSCVAKKQCNGSCPLKFNQETFEKNCRIEKVLYTNMLEAALKLVFQCSEITWLRHGIPHIYK
jgi:radical SAM protein with 4Fe4S-binding SPASM domain